MRKEPRSRGASLAASTVQAVPLPSSEASAAPRTVTQPRDRARIRVLFVLIRLEKNGAVLNALSIMRQLDPNRFEPVLFLAQRNSLGPYWSPLLEGIRVIYGTQRGTWTHHLYRVLPRLLSAAKAADVTVGALEASATYLAVFGATLTGRPSLGLVQNSLLRHLERMPFIHKQLMKKTYPYLTLAVGVSAGVQGEVEALVPELSQRVRTSHNLIDVADVQAASREPLPASAPSRPFILAAGRLEYQKGFDLLVHAYAALKNDKPDLVILGDGPERARLEALARTHGVAEQVSFSGFQENPYAWMSRCELFVSSSRYEGFCRVIAEALAVGAPVVATDCPSGPAEILGAGNDADYGGDYGVLVPTEDVGALSSALGSLLNDGERAAKLRLRGAARAEAFDVNSARSFEASLLEALAQHDEKSN